jgi:hypothetical protein
VDVLLSRAVALARAGQPGGPDPGSRPRRVSAR